MMGDHGVLSLDVTNSDIHKRLFGTIQDTGDPNGIRIAPF